MSPHEISVYITYSDDEVTKNMSISLDKQMRLIARNTGVILLYHSVMKKTPKALGKTLHNVTDQQLKKHLMDLSGYFKFVPLDEFSQADSKAGLASITFDDGYKSVLENALPVLELLDFPFTVFLNPLTFENRWNWRDKVRHLIHHDQVDDFLETCDLAFTDGRFYRFSKNPANNSADLDSAIDRFLAGQAIDIYDQYPYLSKNHLIDCPLVSYGNHSLNHYVLSSLGDQQQVQEIRVAQHNIENNRKLKLSRCFSAPFGGTRDINSTTLNIIRDLSYQSLLMSRQQLQPQQSLVNKVQILERFMPRSDNIIDEIVSLGNG